jgi:hypothetical protein
MGENQRNTEKLISSPPPCVKRLRERTEAAGDSVLVYQFRDVALLERSQQRVFT